MQHQKEYFIINRIKSLRYVVKGIARLFCSEKSVQVQIGGAAILSLMGFYFGISATHWCLQTLIIGGILGLEALNSAIEKAMDFIHPTYHQKVGIIKDMAAAAVGFFALASLVVLIIIYAQYC